MAMNNFMNNIHEIWRYQVSIGQQRCIKHLCFQMIKIAFCFKGLQDKHVPWKTNMTLFNAWKGNVTVT